MTPATDSVLRTYFGRPVNMINVALFSQNPGGPYSEGKTVELKEDNWIPFYFQKICKTEKENWKTRVSFLVMRVLTLQASKSIQIKQVKHMLEAACLYMTLPW